MCPIKGQTAFWVRWKYTGMEKTVGAAEAGAGQGLCWGTAVDSRSPGRASRAAVQNPCNLRWESAWLRSWGEEGPCPPSWDHHCSPWKHLFPSSPGAPAVQAHVYNLIRCRDLSLWVVFSIGLRKSEISPYVCIGLICITHGRFYFLLLGQSRKLKIKLRLGTSSKYISNWNQDLGNEIGICLLLFWGSNKMTIE